MSPRAICFFAPNGQTNRPRERFRCSIHGLNPEPWSHKRTFVRSSLDRYDQIFRSRQSMKYQNLMVQYGLCRTHIITPYFNLRISYIKQDYSESLEHRRLFSSFAAEYGTHGCENCPLKPRECPNFTGLSSTNLCGCGPTRVSDINLCP